MGIPVCVCGRASEGCGKRDDVEKGACRHFRHGELLLMCLDCFSTRVSLLSLAGRLVMLLHWKSSGVNFTGGQGAPTINHASVFRPKSRQPAASLTFPSQQHLFSLRAAGVRRKERERERVSTGVNEAKEQGGDPTSHMWILVCILTASTIKHVPPRWWLMTS